MKNESSTLDLAKAIDILEKQAASSRGLRISPIIPDKIYRSLLQLELGVSFPKNEDLLLQIISREVCIYKFAYGDKFEEFRNPLKAKHSMWLKKLRGNAPLKTSKVI